MSTMGASLRVGRYRVFDFPVDKLPQRGSDLSTGDVEALADDAETSHHAASSAPAEADKARASYVPTPRCAACGGLVFEGRDAQLQHYRSEWHRHNAARRLRNERPWSEAEFEAQLDSLSISASEDSDEDSDGHEHDAAAAQMTTKLSLEERGNDLQVNIQTRRRSSPQVEFRCGDGEGYLRVWKAALPPSGADGVDDDAFTAAQRTVDAVRRLQQQCVSFCVFLCGGGHFASAVFERGRGRMLEHASFHRYTVRKKQGGEQNFNERASRAKSAGATLRRHNLRLLREEVRAVLRKWAAHIAAADVVLLQVPSASTREFFLGFDDSPLQKREVRKVPFPTRRPTMSEVKRVYEELTSVYVHRDSAVSADIAAARREAALEELRRPKALHVPPPASAQKGTAHLKKRPAAERPPSANEDAGGDVDGNAAGPPPLEPGVARLLAACCTGGVDTINNAETGLLSAHFPSGSVFPFDASAQPHGGGVVDHSGRTPLVVAALCGHAASVEALLERGADPIDQQPYHSAADRTTRDTFRAFWGRYPDRWPYQEGGLPSPLTSDMQAERSSKQREKRRRAKERQKLVAKAEEEQRAAREAEEAWRNLPEREKRARALEMRSGALALQCRFCGRPLRGVVPFERLGFKYCSTDCVHKHRQEIGR